MSVCILERAPLRHGGGAPDGGSRGLPLVQAGRDVGAAGNVSTVPHALLQAPPRLRHVVMVATP